MRPSDVGEYLTAQGRCFASSEELCALLGVAPAVLPSSLRRAVARGDFVKVCRGVGRHATTDAGSSVRGCLIWSGTWTT